MGINKPSWESGRYFRSSPGSKRTPSDASNANTSQQQTERAFIHHATAECNLGLFTLATLGNTTAPRTVILVETDQPRTRIDIQLLRYSGVHAEKAPPSCKVDQSALANINIYRDEVADVLMDVLLHGIAPIDTGTDLAEHLVPRAPNLREQVATQRSQVLVEASMAIARAHTESHLPIKIPTQSLQIQSRAEYILKWGCQE
jgi:hypothetical protein